jgi:CheY-like chemotaxis protein
MYRDLDHCVELLLVEDNPADVRLLREGLMEARTRYHLTVVPDGEQAIQFLHRSGIYADAARPDLILLDLNLPGKNGFDVLAELKGDVTLKLIPVVILTSSLSQRDILTTYGLGANSYLHKPNTLEETFDLMKTVEHYWLTLAILPSAPRA